MIVFIHPQGGLEDFAHARNSSHISERVDVVLSCILSVVEWTSWRALKQGVALNKYLHASLSKNIYIFCLDSIVDSLPIISCPCLSVKTRLCHVSTVEQMTETVVWNSPIKSRDQLRSVWHAGSLGTFVLISWKTDTIGRIIMKIWSILVTLLTFSIKHMAEIALFCRSAHIVPNRPKRTKCCK